MTVKPYRFHIVGLHHHQACLLEAAVEDDELDTLITPTGRDYVDLSLVPQPTNPNDPNAISVEVPGSATVSGDPIVLGFIGRDKAPLMHKVMAAGGIFGTGLIIKHGLKSPDEGVVWAGRIETDAPDQICQGLKFLPDATLRGMGGAKPSLPRRPRRRKGDAHFWI